MVILEVQSNLTVPRNSKFDPSAILDPCAKEFLPHNMHEMTEQSAISNGEINPFYSAEGAIGYDAPIPCGDGQIYPIPNYSDDETGQIDPMTGFKKVLVKGLWYPEFNGCYQKTTSDPTPNELQESSLNRNPMHVSYSNHQANSQGQAKSYGGSMYGNNYGPPPEAYGKGVAYGDFENDAYLSNVEAYSNDPQYYSQPPMFYSIPPPTNLDFMSGNYGYQPFLSDYFNGGIPINVAKLDVSAKNGAYQNYDFMQIPPEPWSDKFSDSSFEYTQNSVLNAIIDTDEYIEPNHESLFWPNGYQSQILLPNSQSQILPPNCQSQILPPQSFNSTFPYSKKFEKSKVATSSWRSGKLEPPSQPHSQPPHTYRSSDSLPSRKLETPAFNSLGSTKTFEKTDFSRTWDPSVRSRTQQPGTTVSDTRPSLPLRSDYRSHPSGTTEGQPQSFRSSTSRLNRPLQPRNGQPYRNTRYEPGVNGRYTNTSQNNSNKNTGSCHTSRD